MIYLDASVVFSLYFRDSNTPEAMRLVGAATQPLLVSAFCEMETINALGLRVFRSEMTQRNLKTAVKDLESDLQSGFLQWKPIPPAAFTRAKALAQKITPAVGVRAADVLHIAVAFELNAKSIYTLDQKQHTAALAVGLLVNQLPKS